MKRSTDVLVRLFRAAIEVAPIAGLGRDGVWVMPEFSAICVDPAFRSQDARRRAPETDRQALWKALNS